MNIFFLLLIIVGVSVQNICAKAYNNKVSELPFSYIAVRSLLGATIFIATAKGGLHFNTGVLKYSLLFATAFSVTAICSFMAIRTGSLSLTSLISQYSLVIPAFYGLIFLGEPIKITMIVGIALLLVSIFMINSGKKDEETKITFKWAVFAFLAFAGNGACSVIQKVQQIESGGLYRSELMIVAYAITAATLMCFAFFTEKKDIAINIKKGFGWSVLCGLANGIVNLLVLVLATRMAASVMFPVISAGGIVTTALVAMTLYKEKLSLNQKIAMVLGLAAVIILNL